MRTESFASPLTVWVGSMRYVFAPGRDVTVGYGKGFDVPLDRPGNAPSPTPHPDVVLRFAGNQWVAIDRSPGGIFVEGYRVSPVNIRDGQAITIGDPHRGPRLIFRLVTPASPRAGPPARPPAPVRRPPLPPPPRAPPPPPRPPPPRPPPPLAPQPNQQLPTQRATQQMRVPPPRPPAVERPNQPPAPPPGRPVAPSKPPSVPSSKPPAPVDEQRKDRDPIATNTTRKLPTAGPSLRPEEANRTYRLPLAPDARTIGVAAYQLGLNVDGRELLNDVSLTARPGTLTAVIGPSAVRNSALLGVLAGARELSSGSITIDGHDLHAEPESMRSRIGIVARDDRMHSHLTVEQALGDAAELRLPPDILSEHRRRVVDQVVEQLELSPHRATRISTLPPEVRRCASMAIDLITSPTLLVVDEPSAGLDEAQENHVMVALRRQADIGCAVVVAVNPQHSQTSLTHLDKCDQVVLLKRAGSAAFVGPPRQIE